MKDEVTEEDRKAMEEMDAGLTFTNALKKFSKI